MRVIHKFSVGTREDTVHNLPRTATITHVDTMLNKDGRVGVYFWAMIDPELPNDRRKFRVMATGEYTADLGRPIGTALYGNVVLHLVELIGAEKPMPVGIGEEN